MLFIVAPEMNGGLKAQSYTRTFEFTYTKSCSTFRQVEKESKSCRVEGYRTTKLTLYSNSTFIVEMEDQIGSRKTKTSKEGVYQKTEAEIVFSLERLIDSDGDVQFVSQEDSVLYEEQSHGMYIRGGAGLLWGRGAKENEGLFE